MGRRGLTLAIAVAAAGTAVAVATARSANPDANRGQRVFQACAACHSLQPNQNMTGPSLAGLWNRKAGGLASFLRYSAALKSSNIVWNDKTLDEWIEDPQRLVSGNGMPFAGIKNAQQRADLLAFLKEATLPGYTPPNTGQMSGGVANLKELTPEQKVQTVTHCGDTYRVTTANGKTRPFWERNLRLKTDSSAAGPLKGVPALMPAGMMGDRADLIFAAPEEISAFIKPGC